MQWNNQKFKALVDSEVTRNYILPNIVKRLKIPYRQKKNLYLLVTILGDLISYKNKVICIKTEPLELRIEE